MARIRPVRSWPILGVPTLAQVEAENNNTPSFVL